MLEAAIFQDSFSKACNGRSYSGKRKGCMGLGPAETREEDVVVVMLGGSVPFILREKGTRFTLVGKCYVHGAIKGEVIKDDSVGFQKLCIV
jgi:hypothetical protein